MKIFHAILVTFVQIMIYIVIPIFMVTSINSTYPGLMEGRYIHLVQIATMIGVPIVIFYILSSMTSGLKSLIFEVIALGLVILYTFMILGMGHTQLSYENIVIRLYYPTLLYIIIFGIALRFPAALFKYLAERESEGQYPQVP